MHRKLQFDISNIISAEQPAPAEDYEIVKVNMFDGPCGAINKNYPCKKDNMSSKKYPRVFLYLNEDGYLSCRIRRKPEDGGFQAIFDNNYEVDNRWIVTYCPFLLKIFDAHIKVKFCKSI